jgi:hypothetical protein
MPESWRVIESRIAQLTFIISMLGTAPPRPTGEGRGKRRRRGRRRSGGKYLIGAWETGREVRERERGMGGRVRDGRERESRKKGGREEVKDRIDETDTRTDR